MQLIRGSDEYKKFRDAMYHEFTLSEQAFDEFFMLAGANIHGQNDYETLGKLYNSYSKFITHLYEFYVSCFKHDRGETDNISHTDLDALFTSEVEKLMRNMCSLIENGKAPSWVNDLSYYQESVPQDFGQKLRGVRNNTAHVDYRRTGGGNRPSLKEFMDSYHKFLFFLYDSSRYLWSAKRDQPYEVDHIREFDLSR